jgi:hypothetical protein
MPRPSWRTPLVAEAYQQASSIGADQPVTVLALAQAVSQALDVEPLICHLPGRKWCMRLSRMSRRGESSSSIGCCRSTKACVA